MKKITVLLVSISLFSLCKAQYTDIVDFNGTISPQGLNPYGNLTLSVTGDTLFGMTAYGSGYGNIFCLSSGGYADLYDFSGTDGLYPYGSLTVSGSVLYGMTAYGGAFSAGNVFSIYTNGTGYNDILDFNGFDGAFPNGNVILSGDSLYGMTSEGGSSNDGSIFLVTTSGTYTDLFDFNGYNGDGPYGSLLLLGHKLFGMTNSGGTTSYDGNIFMINTDGTGFIDLLDFNGYDGNQPYGSLTSSPTGDTLYGTTAFGGYYGYGNVFSLVYGSGFTDLYDFSAWGNDGAEPLGDVTYMGGVLYGTTDWGGLNAKGNIFSINPDGSNYADLFDMSGSTGEYLYGNVTFSGSGSKFFGMTVIGGTYNDGTIFRYEILSINGFKVTDVTCTSGSIGSAEALVSGGTTPYTYYWTPGGSTDETLTGLSAGSYTVTVIDNTGSTATSVAVIGGVTVFIANSINIACNGDNNGEIMANISGGTGPYEFSWSNGVMGPGVKGLSAGTYTVTVTDSCGMSATVSATITQPTLLTVTDSVLANVHCSGATGSLTCTVSGGASPYTYKWSDPLKQSTATATGLSAGKYYITVTDTNGCTAIDSAIVSQPTKPPLGVTIARAKNVSCSGSFDGMALALASGGSAPFTYAWTPGGDTTSLVTGLSAGIYTVQTTDTRGCNAVAVANISQPSVLTVTDTTIAAIAAAYPSGGTPPYSYTWAPGGGTGFMVSGISAGTYTVTVTDFNGCEDSAVINLKQALSAGLQLTLHYGDISCGSTSSWVNVSVFGASLPNTLIKKCVVDIYYSQGEFYHDAPGGSINVWEGGDFLFYGSPQVRNLSDSVIEITLGDSTLTVADEVELNGTDVDLLDISLEIQSPCQTGTISFTNTSTTMSESTYTDSTLVGSSYVYSDSAYTTVYTNSSLATPNCYSDISITDFNLPIDAGIGETLTISGSGFGGAQGTGQVKFRDADSAHYIIPKLNSTDYLNWTDNQIQIKLPAFTDSIVLGSLSSGLTLGGGRFTVTNSCGDSVVSSTNLNHDTFSIYYNICQAFNIDTGTHFVKEEILLRKYDTGGGYVFRLDSNSFPRNSYRRNLFYKAMRDWTCYTGMNWRIGKDTTITYNVNSPNAVGVNYVFFTSGLPLGSGTVAETLPWPDACSLDIVQLKEGDMFFNSHINFIYDSTGTRAIGADSEDFYGNCLHELGHFMQLNHSTDPNALMYWTANQGYLSPANRQRLDTGIAAVNGAIYSVNQSIATPGGCHTIPAMTSKNASCYAPSGVNEVKQNSNFTIYPNPSNGTFTIESPVNDYTLIVTNMLGQRILSQRIQEQKTEISLSTVANGMYFIQEQYKNGVAAQKLIITK